MSEKPTPETAPLMHAAMNESIEAMFLAGCTLEHSLTESTKHHNDWLELYAKMLKRASDAEKIITEVIEQRDGLECDLRVERAMRDRLGERISNLEHELAEVAKQRDELMKQSTYSIETMVDRFLSWQLPKSVCADLCATTQKEGRYGTNLLSASEAKEMIEYLLGVKGGEG